MLLLPACILWILQVAFVRTGAKMAAANKQGKMVSSSVWRLQSLLTSRANNVCSKTLYVLSLLYNDAHVSADLTCIDQLPDEGYSE